MGLFGSSPKFDMGAYLQAEAENRRHARTTQNGPWGSVSWVGDTMNVSLSPFEQQQLDAAQAMLPSLSASYGDAAAQRAEQSVYDGFAKRMEPQFKKQQAQAHDMLLNQGLAVGSDAYNSALTELQNNQNDARLAAQNQAVLTGQQAQSQQLGNALSLFGQLRNVNDPTQTYMPGIGASGDNAYLAKYAADASNANGKMGALTGLAGGLLGLGGNIWGSSILAKSDARLKTVVMRNVGRLNNGVPVHLYRFKGSQDLYVGPIAQEVAQVMPEAVFEDEDGVLMIDYAALLGRPNEENNAEADYGYEDDAA